MRLILFQYFSIGWVFWIFSNRNGGKIYLKNKQNYTCIILGYGETGEVPVYGTHSILPKEHGAKSFALPIVRHLTREVGAIATWDSSIHESLCLNTVTSGM